uniref:Uncharacterized protein n=1 Tax=Triticum urartu TaxID=4572 RepID=A0A8R7TGN9_TRIUA
MVLQKLQHRFVGDCLKSTGVLQYTCSFVRCRIVNTLIIMLRASSPIAFILYKTQAIA